MNGIIGNTTVHIFVAKIAIKLQSLLFIAFVSSFVFFFSLLKQLNNITPGKEQRERERERERERKREREERDKRDQRRVRKRDREHAKT